MCTGETENIDTQTYQKTKAPLQTEEESQGLLQTEPEEEPHNL